MRTIEEIEKAIKKISTTIKRKWMDPILWMSKTVELKECNEHWERLRPFIGDHGTGECRITFLCGRKVYKYWVLKVEIVNESVNIDGKFCRPHWRITLHGRACTHPAAGDCDHRDLKVNKNLEAVPFCCRMSTPCEYEEE